MATPRRLLWLVALGALVTSLAAPEHGRAASVPDLQLGSEGAAVLTLNRRLHELTYLRRKQIGSLFTRATFHAVVAFQKYSGLARDGIVGPKTRAPLRVARRPRPVLAAGGRRIEVSLRRQLTFLIRRGIVRRTTSVSTGKSGYATPSGDFSIYRRERLSWSIVYDVWLPWAAYFHPKGLAFHRSRRVPPYPTSHGCVRVPPPFAREVYRFAEIGTRVIIR